MTAEVTAGAIARLRDLVHVIDPARVLLITGGASYAHSGAEPWVENAIHGLEVTAISGVSPNPTLDDVDTALLAFRRAEPDLVIAVGGGSVIDLAKVVRSLGCVTDRAEPFAVGAKPMPESSLPLIAIPTTAGTGAEATHFAVVYVRGEKHSVAAQSMRPDHVILDPELTWSMPPDVTAATGLDALCQGIESIWAVHSTDRSRRYAEAAVQLAVASLERAVASGSPVARQMMLESSHLAGRAIDISKTTAPHAMSYSLTQRFGVPHGIAVAMTLGPVLVFNRGVTDDDCADPRGPDHVVSAVDTVVRLLDADSAEEASERFHRIVRACGVHSSLREVEDPPDGVRSAIIEGVNAVRLANNPRRMDREDVARLVAELQ